MRRIGGSQGYQAFGLGGGNGEIPLFFGLDSNRQRCSGQCLVGSLTGAVASQKVTEAPKGSLRVDGNHPWSVLAVRELDCEADRPSRDESRAK
jgi:hypothetical protein